MRLTRFEAGVRECIGVARGDRLFDLSEEFGDLAALADACLDAQAGGRASRDFGQLLEHAPSFPVQEVVRRVPLAGCYRVFCVALNYATHADEARLQAPDEPLVFLKLGSTLLDPDADIVAPALTKSLDYEGELGVVIGRNGADLSVDDARDVVLGYTVVNDITARDLQKRVVGSGNVTDWFSAKALDATTPVGPYIVTLDELANPDELSLATRLNGAVVQSARTSEMVASVPEIIAYLSRRVELHPFDLIATGTPAGIGKVTETWLRPGDTIDVEIEGVGRLSNRVGPQKGVGD